MINNLVRGESAWVMQYARHVLIDYNKLDTVAETLAAEKLPLPVWDAPVFLDGPEEAVIDQFLVANAINFCFTHLDGENKGKKYEAHGWNGTFAMWMSLKKAYEEGIPIFDGKFLRDIDKEHAAKLFGDIPMLDERVAQLNNAGKVLVECYDGHFHNFADDVGRFLFTRNGFVDRLIDEFDCFREEWVYNDGQVTTRSVQFDKRAQLAPAMLHARLPHRFPFRDLDQLTVFADYNLPRALHHEGVLAYEPALWERINNEELLEAGSPEEVEIRAATVVAADKLIEKVNEHRASEGKEPINALHMDYALFGRGRKVKEPHHLCKTTAY